uniref:Bm8146 n=1 Tax=Brugia malayi TaxID=6279 RepID=A0A1I9GCA3_BRUMA|nr:Bm8146 [Brugia malayi]
MFGGDLWLLSQTGVLAFSDNGPAAVKVSAGKNWRKEVKYFAGTWVCVCVCVCVCMCVSVCVYHRHACCQRRSEEGVGFLGNEVLDGCEPPPYGCWKLNSGPLKEQSAFLTAEPALPPST